MTRVAREVGTEGELGGQANVKGVSGTWKDLMDNVNFMASNLTTQVRGIARVVTAVARGDLEQKFTIEARGEVAALADTINAMIDTLRVFADQVTGVAREVGTEGVLGGQAEVPNAAGTWKALTDNVNFMANNLTTQVRNIAEVTTAVANGDLSRKITVQAKGEVAGLAETINRMVDQLSSFADEVTRVAREVGVDGRLGGQAEVEGAAGCGGPDGQRQPDGSEPHRPGPEHGRGHDGGRARRPLAEDRRRRGRRVPRPEEHDQHDGRPALVVRGRGHTRRARGRHRGPASAARPQVEGVSGVWRGPDRERELHGVEPDRRRCGNIAEVTTAVADGDLSRKITVEARGEVARLADTINAMVDRSERVPVRGDARRARGRTSAGSAARRGRGRQRRVAAASPRT